ncbi:MAG: hypothetical protein ACRC4M_02820 [Mycoplasma sp.]
MSNELNEIKRLEYELKRQKHKSFRAWGISMGVIGFLPLVIGSAGMGISGNAKYAEKNPELSPKIQLGVGRYNWGQTYVDGVKLSDKKEMKELHKQMSIKEYGEILEILSEGAAASLKIYNLIFTMAMYGTIFGSVFTALMIALVTTYIVKNVKVKKQYEASK